MITRPQLTRIKRSQKTSTNLNGVSRKVKTTFTAIQMLNAVVYNDTIRTLNTRIKLLELLGEPDYYRDDRSFLHYRITESRIAFFTLHTKTIVIKLSEDNAIEWIKIHE